MDMQSFSVTVEVGDLEDVEAAVEFDVRTKAFANTVEVPFADFLRLQSAFLDEAAAGDQPVPVLNQFAFLLKEVRLLDPRVMLQQAGAKAL